MHKDQGPPKAVLRSLVLGLAGAGAFGGLTLLGCSDSSDNNVTPSCATQECARAIRCRKGSCSGPIAQESCCPCPVGTVEDSACAAEGGADVLVDSKGDQTSPTETGTEAGSEAGADIVLDLGFEAQPEATLEAAPSACDFEATAPPAPSDNVLWAPKLLDTGADLLGGHGHDDAHGRVGFCRGTPSSGVPFYKLVAVGFEVDFDIDNDGESGDDFLQPGFWQEATFVGFGESGGRVNVYVNILDSKGAVLNSDTAPEVRVEKINLGGSNEQLPLTSKPANEFQTNFNMAGGGTRYGVGITDSQGATSDRVINLRLPNNHHLCYQLVFQRLP